MDAPDAGRARLLETLERLLQSPAADLQVALSHAADAVAHALRADKVDAFLHDPTRESLVAVGVSNQPLSAQQRRLGLDVLPIANGGRVVDVFQTGETYLEGRVDLDKEELRGIRDALAIRSKVGVPLEVGGKRRGVLMVASLEPNFFSESDRRFAESVARWVSSVAHRAELIDEIARNAVEQGRRAVAEELITVLAHDLRNYLSPIEVRLTLLRRRADRDKRQPDVNDADAACKALERLSDLIRDILDVARIDQGVFSLDLRPIELVALIEETVHALSMPEHPVVLDVHEEVVIVGDPERIRQCLANLLSNALKHSPKDAAVTVQVGRVRAETGEIARVHVIDQGPGVAPDILPHIFDRFVSTRRKGGLGLGLYLAKRIAALHEGDLSVESPPGKGAHFTLSLPCMAAP
jgi:signal transduction histidine kinase